MGTFFGTGRLKPGPGTWASAATVLVYAALSFERPALGPYIACGIAAVATIAGVPASTIVAREAQEEDPGFVVIDEVAGQALTLMACPFGWRCALAGFILFRGFDIVKPPPVRALERLPEGWGIMVDDLGAGIYGLAVLLLLRHLQLL